MWVRRRRQARAVPGRQAPPAPGTSVQRPRWRSSGSPRSSYVDELRQPGRDYPKSIFLATALVLAVFIFPTLAIAWVVPAHQISFTADVMQAFKQLLTHFRLGFAVPLIAIALAIGSRSGLSRRS